METTKRRRFGQQTKLGKRAEDQFADRLTDVGWNAWRPDVDLGEDFHVQIFDEEGIPDDTTGISFYVQVKGTKGSKPGRAKLRGDVVEYYPVEVADLEHWEKQTVLVVFLVWDVETRQGYWETVPRIIEALDRRENGWRNKENGKVKVEVPVSQGTDDGGMQRLRRMVGRHVAPLVRKEGPFRLTVSFPSTDDGNARADAFQKALNEGDSITLQNAYIKNVQYPPWHQRLYGRSDEPIEVTIGPAKPPVEELSLRLQVEKEGGYIAIPPLILRSVRNGLRRKTFETQDSPLYVVLELLSTEEEGGTETLSMERKGIARTPFEEREIIAFLLALSKPGHRLWVTYQIGKEIIERDVPTPFASLDEGELLGYFHSIDKLCAIQQRVRRFGSIRMTNELTSGEIGAIDELFPIVTTGRVETTITLNFQINPDTARDIDTATVDANSHANVKLKLQERPVKLLGLEIEIGPVVMIVKDTPRFLAEYRATLAKARETGGRGMVNLQRLPVVFEYMNWLPRVGRSQILHKLAAEQCGYITLDQAVEAGYSPDTLRIDEHVSDFGNNIFRLMHFPPFEHEDHVITWLLTDKKAIFSHDTALALHQLSDLLPTRQHITLPPDYNFPEGVKLPETVEIHRDIIDPSEITWMGPVPFTKPHRTLFDCINDHLSPDLLDQALAQAKSRGMIGRAEAQALQAQRAKSA